MAFKKGTDSITERFFNQKDKGKIEAVFIGMIVVGLILLLLFIVLWLGIGALGIPLLAIGGVGYIVTVSCKVTDEDYEENVKRLITLNRIDIDNMTLMEYVLENSRYTGVCKDKKIRSDIYCIANYSFKNGVCTLRKHIIDITEDSLVTTEHSFPIGCSHKIEERVAKKGEKSFTEHYLSFNDDPDTAVPVDMNNYDTEAVIKRVTHT